MGEMPSTDEQRRRLGALLQDSADWGALILMSRPGDVSFLVPIVPALAGCEIVAASVDPDVFDIWKDDRIVGHSWSRAQVAAWLSENTPDEDALKGTIAEWTEATLIRYGVPRRA